MSVVPQSGGHCGPLHEEHSQLSQVARLTQTFLGLDLEVYRECGFRVGGGGAQREQGAQKGEGAPLEVRSGVGVGVRSERKMRPRECGGSEKDSMGEELKEGRWGSKESSAV